MKGEEGEEVLEWLGFSCPACVEISKAPCPLQ